MPPSSQFPVRCRLPLSPDALRVTLATRTLPVAHHWLWPPLIRCCWPVCFVDAARPISRRSAAKTLWRPPLSPAAFAALPVVTNLLLLLILPPPQIPPPLRPSSTHTSSALPQCGPSAYSLLVPVVVVLWPLQRPEKRHASPTPHPRSPMTKFAFDHHAPSTTATPDADPAAHRASIWPASADSQSSAPTPPTTKPNDWVELFPSPPSCKVVSRLRLLVARPGLLNTTIPRIMTFNVQTQKEIIPLCANHWFHHAWPTSPVRSASR